MANYFISKIDLKIEGMKGLGDFIIEIFIIIYYISDNCFVSSKMKKFNKIFL